jgi:uncharacterized protein YfkK (UPF0435 family)
MVNVKILTPDDLKALTLEDWEKAKEMMMRHPEFKTLTVSSEYFKELEKIAKEGRD